MEHQRVTKPAQKEQSKTFSSSLRQTSLNHVAVHPILELQRTIGNQAVQNMLRTGNGHIDSMLQAPMEPRFGYEFSQIPVHTTPRARLQTKLTVNQPGDVYEQEADQVAERVMRMTDPQTSLFGNEGGAKDSEMRKQTNGPEAHAATHSSSVPAIVHDVLNSGGGQPLDTATQAFMEPRFGHDFSQVRVHTDVQAVESARAMNALAYTIGRDVVFEQKQYMPGTSEGRRLLAHELAHVVQQSRGGPQPALDPAADHEYDAKAVATAIDAGHTYVAVQGATGVGVARAGGPSQNPLVIPKEVIEMPWVGKGEKISSSEQGYLRDAQYFWPEYSRRWPNQLSPDNRKLIGNGASPVVDDTWLQFHPEHTAYKGELLEHHHVGQGSRTVALPESLHDAYTTFHPQRQVVGEGTEPLRPLKPRPTAQRTETEMVRHIKAGRIRGEGIDPKNPPKAPSVPLSSEAATLPPEQLRPVDPVTGKVIGKPSVPPSKLAGVEPLAKPPVGLPSGQTTSKPPAKGSKSSTGPSVELPGVGGQTEESPVPTGPLIRTAGKGPTGQTFKSNVIRVGAEATESLIYSLIADYVSMKIKQYFDRRHFQERMKALQPKIEEGKKQAYKNMPADKRLLIDKHIGQFYWIIQLRITVTTVVLASRLGSMGTGPVPELLSVGISESDIGTEGPVEEKEPIVAPGLHPVIQLENSQVVTYSEPILPPIDKDLLPFKDVLRFSETGEEVTSDNLIAWAKRYRSRGLDDSAILKNILYSHEFSGSEDAREGAAISLFFKLRDEKLKARTVNKP